MSRFKKEKNPKIKGSLISRILFIIIIFLVIPLFFLSILLYVEDRRIKLKNNLFTIDILMKKKVQTTEFIINQEQNFLSKIGYLISKKEYPQRVVEELAHRKGVAALFHIKKIKGNFICDISSNGRYKGKNFSHLMKDFAGGVYLVMDSSEPIFFLTQALDNGNEAWVSAFSPEFFPLEMNVINHISTSITNNDGVVISSSDARFIGKKFGSTNEENFEYSFENSRYIGIKNHIPQTNFSLLVSASHKINFVDIPYFILKITIILGLILLIGGGGVICFTYQFSKPFNHLIQVMYQVGQGDLSKRFQKDSMGFELNKIGEIFNETLHSLIHHMETAKQERIEKEIYAKELLIGEEVQNSILPKVVPKFPGIDLAVHFISAKEVGGDFYDFLPNDKLMITIADTSGKGISACLYSFSVRSMLRSYGEIHHELDMIVNETNNLFCLDTGDTGVFVTAFVAFYDPKTQELHYTNCGHLPALCVRKDGKVDKFTTPGMALGVTQFDQVITKRVKLEEGDFLVLLTDGILEAHNNHQEFFGEKKLIDFFHKKKDLTSQQIVNALIAEVDRFTEGALQHDDITLLVMRVLPLP